MKGQSGNLEDLLGIALGVGLVHVVEQPGHEFVHRIFIHGGGDAVAQNEALLHCRGE